MEDANKVDRSIADDIGGYVFESVQTPVEIFFLALFVFGFLSIAATTLVGSCGRVDDASSDFAPRILDIVPGSTVVTRTSVVLEDTVVGVGTCAIVESVDVENETVRIHVFAKAQPPFISSAELYRPLSAFSGFSETPVSATFWLHSGSPIGDVELFQIAPISTKPYTNFFRHFYTNTIYSIMGVLALIVIFLVYIGKNYEKKRKEWYSRHTLRALYISRLTQDTQQRDILHEYFERAVGNVNSGDPSSWKEALTLLDKALGGVLTLLRFDGNNVTNQIRGMTKEDLWTIDSLWRAHSLILRVQGKVDDDKGVPSLTKGDLEKIIDVYKESLIWLGLLPHDPV